MIYLVFFFRRRSTTTSCICIPNDSGYGTVQCSSTTYYGDSVHHGFLLHSDYKNLLISSSSSGDGLLSNVRMEDGDPIFDAVQSLTRRVAMYMVSSSSSTSTSTIQQHPVRFLLLRPSCCCCCCCYWYSFFFIHSPSPPPPSPSIIILPTRRPRRKLSKVFPPHLQLFLNLLIALQHTPRPRPFIF